MLRFSRTAGVIIAATLAAFSAGAQVVDEPPPGPLLDYATVSTLGEAEPLDRIAAQRALLGNYQTEDFKNNAIAELARKQQLYPNQLAGASPPKAMPVWTSIGPTRDRFLQNGVTLTKVTDSGRVATILPHPTDPDTMYVLTSGGGLWKTNRFTHNNAKWVPLTDALVSTSGGAAALGRDPNTIYLGIGDSFDVEGLIAGVMVKSADAGVSWSAFVNLPNATAVRDVKVDTSGSVDAVLVATDTGLFRSTDAGATYTVVLPNRSVWSLAKTNQGWLASTVPASQVYYGGGRLYQSVDGGASWALIPTPAGVGRMTLAVATAGDPVVYSLAGSPGGNYQANLYRSSDGGLTWTALGVNQSKVPQNPNCQQPDLNLLSGQAYYNQAIVVDPRDPQRNTVYIGGQRASAKSLDGGASWTLTSTWLPGICGDGSDANVPYVHADFHAAAIITSGGTSTLVFGTDGGLAVSMDGGASFDTQVNRGLVTHLSQTVVSSTKVAFNTLTGMQDDGTRMRVGGNSGVWNQVIGGDGEGAGWSQANNAVALGSVYNSQIRRYPDPHSNPQPFNWANATNGIGGLDLYPFFTPIATPSAAADPTGLTFFTSTGLKVYRTTDGAQSWQPIFNSYPSQSFNLSHNVIGVDPLNVARVAMAGTGGRAFITSDGGAHWSFKFLKALAPPYPGINISPSWGPNNTLYMASAYAGSGKPRVVRSADGGNTWSVPANTGLPDVLLSQILADPRDSAGQTAYAATQLGVYVTFNGGTNWTLLGAGLPNVWVKGMYLSDGGLLRVAAYGRGMWEIQL
jgi:hypothetical protein